MLRSTLKILTACILAPLTRQHKCLFSKKHGGANVKVKPVKFGQDHTSFLYLVFLNYCNCLSGFCREASKRRLRIRS